MTTDPDSTVLALPADARGLRTIRLVAASLADDAGLDFEDVEDVRLAVDELCALVIDAAAASARLKIRFSVEPGRISVVGDCALPDGASAPELPRLSAEILAAVADDHRLGVEHGECHFAFTKRHIGE